MLEGRIARLYEHMSRKDVDALMAEWPEDAAFEFPGRTPHSGRHEGRAEVRAFFEGLFAELDSIRFTIHHAAFSNPIPQTRSNDIYVEWSVDDVARDGRTMHNDGITVFHYRHGRLVGARDYFYDLAALEAFANGPSATRPA